MFTIKGMKVKANLYGGAIGIVALDFKRSVRPDVGQLAPILPSL